MIGVFQSLSRYNSWANAKIYQVCTELSETELSKPVGVQQKSIYDALKKVLVDSQNWVSKVDGNATYELLRKENLPSNLIELGKLQHRMDLRLIDVTKNITSIDMARTIAYSDFNLMPFHLPLPVVLTNIFVMQIDSRAKIIELFAELKARSISIDYLIFVNDVGLKAK